MVVNSTNADTVLNTGLVPPSHLILSKLCPPPSSNSSALSPVSQEQQLLSWAMTTMVVTGRGPKSAQGLKPPYFLFSKSKLLEWLPLLPKSAFFDDSSKITQVKRRHNSFGKLILEQTDCNYTIIYLYERGEWVQLLPLSLESHVLLWQLAVINNSLGILHGESQKWIIHKI